VLAVSIKSLFKNLDNKTISDINTSMLSMAIITAAMMIITIIMVVMVVVVVVILVTMSGMTYHLVTKLSIFSMSLMPIGFQREIQYLRRSGVV
jgi:hypothetical protein